METNHTERVKTIGRRGYLSLIFWLPLVIVAGMGFDHPRAQEQIGPWFFLGVVLALPIAIVFAPLLARHFLSSGRVRLAYAMVLVPQGLVYLPFLLSLAWGLFWMAYYAF